MTRNQISLELVKLMKELDKIKKKMTKLMEENDKVIAKEKRSQRAKRPATRRVSGSALPAPETPLVPSKSAVISGAAARLQRP